MSTYTDIILHLFVLVVFVLVAGASTIGAFMRYRASSVVIWLLRAVCALVAVMCAAGVYLIVRYLITVM